VKHIGILHHPRLPAARLLAEEIAAWLAERGITSRIDSALEEGEKLAHLNHQDMVITLGGDGTILRAARLSAMYNVPLLGINMGRVGFLTEFTPQDWQERLPAVLEGQYWVEERIMLRASASRQAQPLGTFDALNDVVVARGELARVLHVEASVNDTPLTTYVADGVIVATPTGSTAYALSAGGPILSPDLEAMLIIPVAPHLAFNRALVLPAGSQLTFAVRTYHHAQLIVDGQGEARLLDGDVVQVTISPYRCRFVRTQPRNYFYQSLVEKLHWRT
jgi:NAD+ kinase